MSQDDGGATVIDPGTQQSENNLQQPSEAQLAFLQARQRRKIAELEDKIETLESGRTSKERQTNYYLTQGRGIRRIVALYDSIEDLISENDRRYDEDFNDEEVATFESVFRPRFFTRVLTLICLCSQERLQTGYDIMTRNLPWIVKQSSNMEHDEYVCMLKMLRQGADGARGDDTAKLKTLVADWVNRDLNPNPLVDSDDKHHRGFINDACGKLLCPAELDWNNPATKAGIRDRSEGYTVTELSFPSFLYEKYTANLDNLEAGLFKGQILVQGYKAVFTSPSSAKDIDGDGDGADVIENNRRARRAGWGLKVKKHVRFALSSITSWRTIDGDFDYVQFWRSIVDFFERPPGREARRRVNKLLEWWNRKVFGRSHRQNLSDAVRSNMSVNALARQRAAIDDASFDSN
ncbi:hypothetical protein EDD22DRAFT_779270 [Suillus occidentalis]|nr:hypothetical protein EDD22DRAFT_779270 [Suillus occidentalis]